MMKIGLAAVAAGFLLSASSASALEVIAGSVTGSLGQFQTSTGYDETDAVVRGSVLLGGLGMFDLGLTATAGLAQLPWRDTPFWFASTFASLNYITPDWAAQVYGGAYFCETCDDASYEVGVQGVRYLGNFDVGGGASYGIEANDPNPVGAWLYANFYPEPNTVVGATLYGSTDGFWDELGLSFGAEHRLEGKDFGFFLAGGFECEHWDEGMFTESKNIYGQLGVRFYFDPDGSTLQKFERTSPF